MVQSYLDNTGLYRKYGPDKATSKIAGEPVMTGDIHEIVARIDLTTLTATETILDDVVQIPNGARISEVNVLTHTAAATGTAIDLGVIKTDRTTEGDYNGFLAALPTADMNAAGEVQSVVIGHTYVGALVGTTIGYTGYLSASRTDATAFTAGVIIVRVRYYMP